ncbi:unnamed protein product [Discosporangium mesarthrocarpum]
MAHSMGCITSVMAALDPSLKPLSTTLVLVAPALPPAPGARPKARGGNPWGRGGTSGVGSTTQGSRDPSSGSRGLMGGAPRMREGMGMVGGILKATVGVPGKTMRGLLGAAEGVVKWVFDWMVLPLFYPVELVGLRALVYKGKFWRAGLRTAWYDKEAVDVDLVNRYRWPSLVRFWDRGMALFLLSRLQLGGGGVSGFTGLVHALADKAAQGMRVVIVHGEHDPIIPLAKVQEGLAGVIPQAKLVVMPKCGHVPHEEQPEEFVRLVMEALSEGQGDNGG